MIASDNLDTIDRCRNLALRTPITILITAVPVVLLFAKAFNLGGMKMDRGISSLFLVMIAVMVVVNSYGVRWMANRKRFFEHISMVAKKWHNPGFQILRPSGPLESDCRRGQSGDPGTKPGG